MHDAPCQVLPFRMGFDERGDLPDVPEHLLQDMVPESPSGSPRSTIAFISSALGSRTFCIRSARTWIMAVSLLGSFMAYSFP